MNERVNPFANLKDGPAFSAKSRPERPVEPEAFTQIAEENNFTSRQAPKPAKRTERRKPRTHRTGRNAQFNTKATPETIARFYRLVEERGVKVAELFEMAIDALEREGGTRPTGR